MDKFITVNESFCKRIINTRDILSVESVNKRDGEDVGCVIMVRGFNYKGKSIISVFSIIQKFEEMQEILCK